MAFEAQAAYIAQRYAHLLTLERDHERVQQAALRKSVRHCYGTAGRNISNLGINAFSPDPLRKYIGNANHGRVLKSKPQDLRGKWEYDLDDQGCVLQARCHTDRVDLPGIADTVLVPSATENEKTYLHYSQVGKFGIRQDYGIVYAYDAQGRIAAYLVCHWIDDITCNPTFELNEYCWYGERLLWVENYNFWPRWRAIRVDENRAVSIIGQPYQCLYRRFLARKDQ